MDGRVDEWMEHLTVKVGKWRLQKQNYSILMSIALPLTLSAFCTHHRLQISHLLSSLKPNILL